MLDLSWKCWLLVAVDTAVCCRDETIMINLLHASSEARSDQTTAVPVSVSYVGSPVVQTASSCSVTASSGPTCQR